jgi:hypothetical protein
MLMYGVVICIHLGLSGAKYLSFTYFVERGDRPIYKWNVYSGYWDFFMFFSDTIIAIVITLYIVRKDAYYSQMPLIDSFVRLANDKRFMSLSFIQLLTMIFYYLLYYTKIYTMLLQNDRNWLATDGINAFFFSIHAAVTAYSSDCFAIVLEQVKKSRMKRGLINQKQIPTGSATKNTSVVK